MRSRLLLSILLLACAVVPASAQRDTTSRASGPRGQYTASMQPGMTPNRDVILEVPELSVDSIGLTVSNVKAHVALVAPALLRNTPVLTNS